MDTATASLGIFGLIMSFFAIFMGWYILILIARWKVFSKAGIDGWKSLIPIYSDYCTYKIGWQTKYFWYSLAVSLMSGMISNRISAITERGDDVSFLLTLMSFVFSASVLVLNIMMNTKLAEKFGYGILFGLGLTFLTPVFTMFLGLGASEYLGNPEENLPPRRVVYR